MKTYKNVFDLLSENAAGFIDGLTAGQKEAIQHIDDFEFFKYEIENGIVKTYESIYATKPFIIDTLADLINEIEKELKQTEG